MNTESNCVGAGESRRVHSEPVGDDRSVSEAVVRTVASASGREPTAAGGADGRTGLEPLYGAIDPDALDAIFDAVGETERASVEVTFEYAGYEVTVDGTGQVTATECGTPGA